MERKDEQLRFTYAVQKQDEELALRSLLRREFGVSTRLLRRLKETDGVLLDGTPSPLFAKPLAGQVLSIQMPEESSWFAPQPVEFGVVYEDSDLLAVDKPPGLVVHPTNGKPDHTMVNGLAYRMQQRGEQYKIRLVNRLDMDTSGLCIVAKNSYCQDFLMKQMQKNQVEKTYLAFVKGTLTGAGTIDLPIGRKPGDPWRRAVIEGGSPSITHYRSIATFEADASLVELRLETGRTHQIRVHLSHIGYPIISDRLYGNPMPELIGRQALHACRMFLRHPATGETVRLEAPMPQDMQQLRARLGREYPE